MKFKRMCLWALLLGLASCATGRINLVKTGQVSLDFNAVKSVTVLDADVYQDGDKLIIEGLVKSKNGGYVYITVVGPDGTVIKQTSSNYKTKMMAFGPRSTFRMFAHEAYFEEVIHRVPPRGSAVRLEFH